MGYERGRKEAPWWACSLRSTHWLKSPLQPDHLSHPCLQSTSASLHCDLTLPLDEGAEEITWGFWATWSDQFFQHNLLPLWEAFWEVQLSPSCQWHPGLRQPYSLALGYTAQCFLLLHPTMCRGVSPPVFLGKQKRNIMVCFFSQ